MGPNVNKWHLLVGSGICEEHEWHAFYKWHNVMPLEQH